MNALVILADGCEEIEAVTIVDVLRRGGVDVTAASLSGDPRVVGAHRVAIAADAPFEPETASDYDLVALPGGMRCMEALRSRAYVLAALRAAAAAGRIVGAECASPAVLGAAGLLEDRRYCCYPGIEAQIESGTYDPAAATVRDGNIVTGTGPGTAAAFALELLEALAGRETRDKVAAAMLLA
ncbi:MAG: DJ-1/PfpI family protein [Kiritimatiellae bacterium]|nr:DJ-1/PfpI family protein [Kiritimatiellia bacterium]